MAIAAKSRNAISYTLMGLDTFRKIGFAVLRPASNACLLAAAVMVGPISGHAADDLVTGFRTPPAQAKPLAWWHWINGNISKEGIRADLEDMKRVGIAGAQILDVSGYLPPGPVRFGTDAWYEHVRYAIQTAAELGLSIDLMNCPGWSTSGGPWVMPEQSMKEVVWTETNVDGGGEITLKLPEPLKNKDFYRDIAVYAVPADPLPDATRPEITANAEGVDPARLADADPKSVVVWPADARDPVLTFTHSKPVECRLLRLTYSPKAQLQCEGTVEVSDDGKIFRKLRDFSFRGGLADSPSIDIPFPPTRALAFRVTLKAGPGIRPWPLKLGGAEFLDIERTENLHGKIVETTLSSVVPEAPPSESSAGAIDPSSIVELTAQMSADGRLTWKAPAGRWTILRLGYTTTGVSNHPAQPEGTGLEIDKMDAAAVAFHFEKSLGRIIAEAGPSTRTGGGLKGLLVDSWEANQQNWTQEFPAQFARLRGYDLRPFLPALTGRVIGSRAVTEAFLSDFRRTICDLIATEYFATLQKLGREHGLQFYCESYTGHTFNEILAGQYADVNMAEFWGKPGKGEISRVKRSASMANTMGRVLVAAESFTVAGADGKWMQTPAVLKSIGDRAFASGLNKVVFHSYVHQPRSDLAPGFTLGNCGSHFGRLNTWWPLAGAWMDYIARSQFLLQQGTQVTDFLKLRPTDVDILIPPSSPPHPGGYDFDYVGEEQIRGASVAENRIVLPAGASYRALILPDSWVADTALLQAVEKIADAGVPVYGTKPVAPASYNDLKEGGKVWNEVVARLWGENGKVQPAGKAKDFEKTSGVPEDFHIEAGKNGGDFTWSHRRAGNTDIYFISNAGSQQTAFTATLRVTGRQPELWDAMSGRFEALPLFQEGTGTTTTVSLELPASGAVFVVFRNPLPACWMTSLQRDGQEISLGGDVSVQGKDLAFAADGRYTMKFNDGRSQELIVAAVPASIPVSTAWQVSFQPPNRNGFVRNFETLASWSGSSDEAVRYFSGQATYQARIEVPAIEKGQRCFLDLGEVSDIARVRINGRDAGTLWTPPYAADVTDLLVAGENTVEITVANRWVNRMIGDEQLPADVEYASTGAMAKLPDWFADPEKARQRQRVSFPAWRFFTAESPLIQSGLLGPVTLKFKKVAPIPFPQPAQ